MQRTNESIFIIDRLQLDCRASSAQRSAYLAISGLVIGAFTGSILALCWWTSYQFDPVCPAETRIPLWLWISVYAVWAMAMNALDLRRPPWLTTGLHRSAAARWWAASFRAVMMFVTSTIPWLLLHYLFGTRYGARAGMAPVAEACTRTATTTLRLGHRWISSGFVALVYGGTLRGETDLTPVEATGWSCRLAVPGLLYGLAIGGMSVVLSKTGDTYFRPSTADMTDMAGVSTASP